MGRRITRPGGSGESKTPPDERAGGGDAEWRGGRLGANDVRRVQPFVASLHLELHHLPFSERLEAVHLDGREVHEHVLAALLFNEAVPLGIIEPLHLSLSHSFCLLLSHPIPWGAVAPGPAPMSGPYEMTRHGNVVKQPGDRSDRVAKSRAVNWLDWRTGRDTAPGCAAPSARSPASPDTESLR